MMKGVTKRSQRKAQAKKKVSKRLNKTEVETFPCADPTMIPISNYENGST